MLISVFDFIHVVRTREVERGRIFVVYSNSVVADHGLIINSIIPLLLCLVIIFKFTLFIYVLFQRGVVVAVENWCVLRNLIVVIVNRSF